MMAPSNTMLAVSDFCRGQKKAPVLVQVQGLLEISFMYRFICCPTGQSALYRL